MMYHLGTSYSDYIGLYIDIYNDLRVINDVLPPRKYMLFRTSYLVKNESNCLS